VVDHERFDRILDEYYDARGWNITTGIPKLEKLESLELYEIVHQKR
jgi:aldehyde:ferredoxin oxidoreductase